MRPNKWSLILTGQNTGCIAPFGDPWAHSPAHFERVNIMEIPADGDMSMASTHAPDVPTKPAAVNMFDDLEERLTVADYQYALKRQNELVRKLDVLLNGDAREVTADLSELVSQIEREGLRSRGFVPVQAGLF